MKTKTEQMLRPGHTYRVKKPGDPWNRRHVAATMVSNTGAACCVQWRQLAPALQSPAGSPLRKKLTYRDYGPQELVHINL